MFNLFDKKKKETQNDSGVFSIQKESIDVGVNIDDGIEYPVSNFSLYSLYDMSVEHSRCCQIKAEGSTGGGFDTEKDSQLLELERLSHTDLNAASLDYQVYGNAYFEVVKAPRGQILKIRHLPALTMYRHRNAKDFIQLTFTPDGNEIKTVIEGEYIIHLRTPCPLGSFYSKPSWYASHLLCELAHKAMEYNIKFMENNARPEFAIMTKGSPLNRAQKNNIIDFFKPFRGVKNAGKALYLHQHDTEGGIEFKDLSKNEQGSFLKVLDAVRDRVPIAHGVPPRMLGIIAAGSLGGGSEVIGQMHTFEQLTLNPIKRQLLAQLGDVFSSLKIKPQDVKFKPIDLTPPDNSQLSQNVQTGILTQEEAREMLNKSQPSNDIYDEIIAKFMGGF